MRFGKALPKLCRANFLTHFALFVLVGLQSKFQCLFCSAATKLDIFVDHSCFFTFIGKHEVKVFFHKKLPRVKPHTKDVFWPM